MYMFEVGGDQVSHTEHAQHMTAPTGRPRTSERGDQERRFASVRQNRVSASAFCPMELHTATLSMPYGYHFGHSWCSIPYIFARLQRHEFSLEDRYFGIAGGSQCGRAC